MDNKVRAAAEGLGVRDGGVRPRRSRRSTSGVARAPVGYLGIDPVVLTDAIGEFVATAERRDARRRARARARRARRRRARSAAAAAVDGSSCPPLRPVASGQEDEAGKREEEAGSEGDVLADAEYQQLLREVSAALAEEEEEERMRQQQEEDGAGQYCAAGVGGESSTDVEEEEEEPMEVMVYEDGDEEEEEEPMEVVVFDDEGESSTHADQDDEEPIDVVNEDFDQDDEVPMEVVYEEEEEEEEEGLAFLPPHIKLIPAAMADAAPAA